MKILQINKYYYKKGGAETAFFNTIRLLEAHGHTVIPFCLENKKNQVTPYSSYFVNYPELSEASFWNKVKNFSSFLYNKEAAEKLEKLIQENRPDIAHIHLMFNSLSISILPILKKYNIPIVMSVHDYRLVCPAYTFTDGKGHFCERCNKGNYYNCVLHNCSKSSIVNSFMLALESYYRNKYYPPIEYIDRFFFVGKFSMNKHIQIDQRYKEKGTFLYNFTPTVEQSKPQKGNYIFFFGRISNEKGIVTLLNALKQIPTIKLKLAGTGPLLESLKSICPPNAEFVGFKQGTELHTLIREASFIIVPSECYENNPMTIIESYMNGKPVIGSNLGGIPELISEGKTGYVFTPKSPDDLASVILKAYSLSEQEYWEMSINARRFAIENFSEEQHYHRLMENYQLAIKIHK